LRKIILFIFATFLFSFDLKIYHLNIKVNNAKYIHSLNEVNLSNDILIIPANNLDYVIKNNLVIIGGYEKANRYILLNKNLNDINTVGNADLISKIFFKTLNKHIIYKKASLKDFINKKVDAIVVERPFYLKKYPLINLRDLGIKFNQFILTASNKIISENTKLIYKIKNEIALKYSLEDERIFNELFHTAYYLNKKINYSQYVFNDVKLNKKFYKVVVTPNWQPFDIYENNELKGIGIDMFKLIAKKSKINYEFYLQPNWNELINDFKDGIYDITPNTSETKDRDSFAIFTKPYMEFPLAIVCSKKDNISSIDEIKTLAVGKNFTAYKMMLKHYPNLNYVLENNIYNVLMDVKNKKAECGVDILPVIAYNIQKGGFNNLEIKILTPFKFKLQIMLRKGLEDLRDKLNRVIDSISAKQKQGIIEKYINLTIIKKNKTPIWIYLIIIVLVVIISIIYLFNKKYDNEANIDELTQAYNRRFLDKFIKKHKNDKFSLIYLDIDHFKELNDKFGHDFGDYVLKEFVNLIKSHIRENDILIRLGGEEFLIILDTNYEKALKVAEKLRKIIESYNFKGVKITASFGVAFKDKDDNFEEVIKKSDESLYNAKNSGRNQVKGYK